MEADIMLFSKAASSGNTEKNLPKFYNLTTSLGMTNGFVGVVSNTRTTTGLFVDDCDNRGL